MWREQIESCHVRIVNRPKPTLLSAAFFAVSTHSIKWWDFVLDRTSLSVNTILVLNVWQLSVVRNNRSTLPFVVVVAFIDFSK